MDRKFSRPRAARLTRGIRFHHFPDFIMIAGGDCRFPPRLGSPVAFGDRRRQTATKITLFRTAEKV